MVAAVGGDLAAGELPYLSVGRWRNHRAVVEHGEHLGGVQRHRACVGRSHRDGLGGSLGDIAGGEEIMAVLVVEDADLDLVTGAGFTVKAPRTLFEA